MVFKTILILFTCLTQLNAQTKHGNYLDSRIGDANNQNMDMLLYHPDREWLYDFDAETPFEGIVSSTEGIQRSDRFYMSKPYSMKWAVSQGNSLELNATVTIKKAIKNCYFLSVGLFQEDVPTGNNKRVFKVEVFSFENDILHTRYMYLRKGGWNILCSELDVDEPQTLSKVRITQISGSPGVLFVDNFMIDAKRSNRRVMETEGIEQEKLWMENKDDYPVKPLTTSEKEAFLTIAERVIPYPEKVSRLSDSTMNRFRQLYERYNIEIKGEYANGTNPLYYMVAIYDLPMNDILGWRNNVELCLGVGELGKAWYQTNNIAQKEELGNIITNIVKLATTWGGIPNPWYNGRGFADGIYYAKELLAENGVLDKMSEQLFLMYNVDRVLYHQHGWDNAGSVKGRGPDFFWQATADDLNTTGKSIMLSILATPDTPEKARNLMRLKSWLDHVALAYSPSKYGTLKPDGSWYHHGGNRFDNYGWEAGWRGATEFVWWMSHTPFEVSRESKERIHHMANIHFNVMDKDGHVGSEDAMHRIPSQGFMNLALAGSVDGNKEIDPLMGSYWLSYPQDKTYKDNPELVAKMKAQGITTAEKQNSNITLSYHVQNVHRRGDWQIYTRGISTMHYHTQYKRKGYLFYNIGGISLVKDGEASGMQTKYGVSLLLRRAKDTTSIEHGYNYSRAPGVSSVISDFDDLEQLYYQRGSSNFVGGVSTSDGNGIFVQEFDAKQNLRYYSKSVAGGLQFRKSYFFFGDQVVLLASGISNNGNATNVETGLLQEPVNPSRPNTLTLANGATSNGKYDENYSSTDVPWMYNDSKNLGVFLIPDQNYKLFNGMQSFGPLKGKMLSTYLSHEKQAKGWYEYIMCLNTSKKEMQKLTRRMQSKTPDFKVIQRDEKAHIVYSKNHNSTGYTFFDSLGFILPFGMLKSADKQCVVMLKEKGNNIKLTVSYPDKRNEITTENPMGWSTPVNVTLVLNEICKLVNSAQEDVDVNVDRINKTTTVKVMVQDGLSAEILFKKE